VKLLTKSSFNITSDFRPSDSVPVATIFATKFYDHFGKIPSKIVLTGMRNFSGMWYCRLWSRLRFIVLSIQTTDAGNLTNYLMNRTGYGGKLAARPRNKSAMVRIRIVTGMQTGQVSAYVAGGEETFTNASAKNRNLTNLWAYCPAQRLQTTECWIAEHAFWLEMCLTKSIEKYGLFPRKPCKYSFIRSRQISKTKTLYINSSWWD